MTPPDPQPRDLVTAEVLTAADDAFHRAWYTGAVRADALRLAIEASAPLVAARVRAQYDDKMRILAEYENTITWNTSCLGCAGKLDNLIAERAAGYEEGQAEAEARVRAQVAADVRIVLDQRVTHSHSRPGFWDSDNTRCVECAARDRLWEWVNGGVSSAVPTDRPHRYLSTGCLHGEHDYCKAPVRPDGMSKKPATCKFCAAECVCPCHEPHECAPDQPEETP